MFCVRIFALLQFVYILLFVPSYIFSLPKQDKISFGDIAIEKSDNKMTCHQKSSKAIIDWKDFSLDENESLRFIQESDFSVLNRVVTDKISKIYGSIEADGKFYLINQNGIFIGPRGIISARDVILSTLELSNDEYLKQKDFHFSSNKDAQIENFGLIKAVSNDVFIFSKKIENSKEIKAKNGAVNIISASEVLLLDNKKDIIIKPHIDGSISNDGNIKAIEVKLKSSKDSLDSFAINQKGLIEATGFEKRDGKVILISKKGITKNTGTIKSKNKNNTSGKVKIFAEHVVLDEKSEIDVSAKFGRGKILIGGGFQGNDPKIKNAKTVFMGKDAKIFADCLEKGNGGEVILFSDNSTQFYGKISAQGGKISGNGGFAEISSKNFLDFQGLVNLNAENGLNGTVLLDPYNVTIVAPDLNISGSPNFFPTATGAQLSPLTITNLLNPGTNVSLNTSGGGGSEAGNITVAEAITLWTGSGSLTLIADNDIIVNSTIVATGTGSLNLNASNDIAINASIAPTSSSNITLQAANNLSIATGISLGSLTASGDFTFQMNSISVSSSVSMQSTGNLTFKPATRTTTIGIGDSATGSLQINNSVISSLQNGFSLITIGDIAQEAIVDINNATFQDPLQIYSDRIDVDGTLATTGDISFNIALTKDGILNLNSFVTCSSGSFTVKGSSGSSDTFNVNVDPSVHGSALFDANILDVNDINSLNGPSTAAASVVSWTISGSTSGSIGNLSFTNVTNCIAKDTDDTFTIESSGTMDTIDLGSGTNVVNMNGGTVSNLIGDQGNNTYNFNGGSIGDIVGSSGTNTFNIDTGVSITSITSGNGDNTYNINGGDVTDSITTGTGDDIFKFADGQGLTVSSGVTFVSGGAKELNYSAYVNTTRIFINLSDETVEITTPVLTMPPKSTSGFNSGGANTLINPTNLTNLVGNNPLATNTSESELVGPASVWEIFGINSGTVDAIPYAGMPNINGTNNADTFNFSATGTEDRVRGRGGNDSFNFGFTAGSIAAWTGDVTTQLQGGPGDDIFTFYKDVAITATINGQAGTNELRGPPIDGGNSTTDWTISGSSSGTIALNNEVTPTVTTNFSSIEVLTGSDRDDTFNITHNNAQTLTIDGGTGTNKIIGPVATNTWTITGDDAGTLKVGNPPNLISFSNIELLEGNTNVDNFIFNGAFSISGSPGIDGKTGVNSITGADGQRNDWNITADDTGQINIDPLGVAATTTFQNIEDLFGGNSTDNFTFDGAFQVSGTTGIDGGAGTNTITGPNVANTWSINSADTGQISPFGATGPTNFTSSGTLNLVGGAAADSFTFALGSSLSGSIDGTNAASNSIDVTATASARVSVEPGDGIIFGGIDNIQTITGNATTTFIARNDTNLWTISVNNGAVVTNASDNITLITIPFFEGGSGADTFSFTGNFAITGSINGKAGNNTIIASTGVENIWRIIDNNAGTLNPLGGTATSFSNIQNLTGNIGTKDTFIFSDRKGISGIVDGGSCGEGNTLDYSAYTIYVRSSMPPCSGGPGTATNIGAIRFISVFIPPIGVDFDLEKALLSELLITYDFKNFSEFNRFLNFQRLIYIKEYEIPNFLNQEKNISSFLKNYLKYLKLNIKNKIYYPEYEDLIFKDLKKD